MLGTNDTKPQNWVHHDEFYSDYKALVEIFMNLPSKPRVFICRPCPVPGAGNYGINETNIQIEIPLLDQLAAEEKVDIIDMHAALVGKPEFFSGSRPSQHRRRGRHGANRGRCAHWQGRKYAGKVTYG